MTGFTWSEIITVMTDVATLQFSNYKHKTIYFINFVC